MSQKTLLPMPMTTDFLVTRGSGEDRELTAYYVKPNADMELKDSKHPRQVSNNWKKLTIEREYWRRMKVKHALVTELTFDHVVAKNVRAIHEFYDLSSVAPVDAAGVEAVHAELFPLVQLGDTPLNALCNACDVSLGLEHGKCLQVAMHLIAQRRWPANFKVEFKINKPLALNL